MNLAAFAYGSAFVGRYYAKEEEEDGKFRFLILATFAKGGWLS
jgi:hypothetical protein